MMASPHIPVQLLVHHLDVGSLGRAGFLVHRTDGFLDLFALCRTGLALSTGRTGGGRGPSPTGLALSTTGRHGNQADGGSERQESWECWARTPGAELRTPARMLGLLARSLTAETLQQYGTRENRKPEENNKTAENQGPRPGPKDPFFNALAAVEPVGQADRSATARPSAAVAFPGSPAPGQSSPRAK